MDDVSSTLSDLSLYEDTLKFYFVVTEEYEQWDQNHPMKYAREKLREKVSKKSIFEVEPDEIVNICNQFTKKNIVVFNEFSGDVFEKVQKTHALVLGPKCIITALINNVSLPTHIQSPMLNLAMKDCIVCLSSFATQEKAKYRKMINHMGGICIDQLTEAVTHLVTDSVRSTKYELAVINNMAIMKSTWLHAVWDANENDYVLATSPQFNVHKVPAFYNLTVTSTGLSKKDRALIEKLVVSNGGTYRGEFSSSINIVVAKKDSEETPKLKAALTAHKDCLCVGWVVDSADKGYALPLDNYRIDLQVKKTTSTPEKGKGISGNVSQMTVDLSAIPFSGSLNDTSTSNTSRISDSSVLNRQSTEPIPDAADLSFKNAYEKLNLTDAKKAGLFLDGCNVFICGFSNEEKEKVVKILNAGGATRYDTINSNLSHILIGNPSKKDLTVLRTVRYDAILVKLQWLVDSIAAKTAITDCQKYIYRLAGKQSDINDDGATAPSPASKRNILSMSGIANKNANPKRLNFDGNSSNATGTPNKQAEAENMESFLLDQYMNADDIPAPIPKASSTTTETAAKDQFKVPKPYNAPLPQISTDSVSNIGTEDSTITTQDEGAKYLQNLKVFIHGFSEESTETLIEDCEMAGAEVISDPDYQEIVDYLILPIDAMTMDNIKIRAKHMVNQNWLINAKKADKITEIPYYYEPIFFDENLKPLVGMIIAISIYASDERLYLMQLAQILGADVQETFIRGNKPLLICPEPKSPKYEAAIRWNLSVVNRDWLIDCHKNRKRLPVKNYLVGDSIAPIDDVSEDDEVFNSQPNPNEINLKKREHPSKSEEMHIASNRRVDELRGNSNSNQCSPLASGSNPTYEYENEYMKDLSTPTREAMIKAAREIAEMTPQTKRRRYEEAGIKTPEIATTPYLMEQKRQYYEELRLERQKEKEAQQQQQQQNSKTPWTEYKRRFWKNVLGDDYESPSQCFASNTQDVSAINDSIRPTGRQLNYDPPENDTEADRHIQKLADFIKNRNQDENQYVSNEPLPHTEPAESEMINSEPHEVIGWRDPNENLQDLENTPSKLKPVPCFTISCSPEIQSKIINQINSLKGKVCENLNKYDPECTHFVSDRINSSEKALSCISSGKWVLSLDYIEKSYNAGRFLDEELYEWGNPKAKNSIVLKPTEALIANAAYRWRKKVQSSASDSRVFKNFRVILLTSRNDSLRTMVEAGGGIIVNIREGLPLHKQLDALNDVTHVICQPKYTKLSNEEYKALEDAYIPAVSMTFLKSAITEEQFPNVDNYLFK